MCRMFALNEGSGLGHESVHCCAALSCRLTLYIGMLRQLWEINPSVSRVMHTLRIVLSSGT
jgi:hypothetical protein